MIELWISLSDIPAEGREFNFTDQSLWNGPIDEFGVSAKISKDFEATMLVVPQDEGFLVSGEFSGAVRLSCGRCTEEFEQPVSGQFDSFEEPNAPSDELVEESRLRNNLGTPEFDAGGFLWEQFLLALPESPICSEGCKGLCPQCGINKNQGSCACVREEGDPRLAVLRNLKLS